MFAIVNHGGKQYRAEVGKVIVVEKIDGDEGSNILFDKVSMVALSDESVKFNAGKVSGVIVKQFLDEKVISFKKRRRHFGSKRIKGHRQRMTEVLVNSIVS